MSEVHRMSTCRGLPHSPSRWRPDYDILILISDRRVVRRSKDGMGEQVPHRRACVKGCSTQAKRNETLGVLVRWYVCDRSWATVLARERWPASPAGDVGCCVRVLISRIAGDLRSLVSVFRAGTGKGTAGLDAVGFCIFLGGLD